MVRWSFSLKGKMLLAGRRLPAGQLQPVGGRGFAQLLTSLPPGFPGQKFGGGGHKLAAGTRVRGTLAEVEQKILKAICDVIDCNS